ncbi:MAG: S49 family peptidase, partial [Gammaproteobacteria bacterium]|nr:S49 family peptidase [Gammaproteobacteria bacterium]
MNESDSGFSENATPQGKNVSASASDYEAMVQRLAFAAFNEQRRSRRWRIFFIILTFIYLTPVILLTLDLNDLSIPGRDAVKSDKHTAIVKMTGIIASGESAGADNIIEGLQDAFEDDDTAGVILEINSPGGSPVQSANIYEEIKRLREKHTDIPVYAVIDDIAASGGYFVAAAADKIFVNKSSLV